MADLMGIGSILSGLGGVLGPIFGADDVGDANSKNFALQKDQLDYLRNLVSSGSVDAFGNRINFREGGTGPVRTELSGDTKRIADTGLAGALGGETGRRAFSDAGARLASLFSERGGVVRDPLTFEQASGIIDERNDLTKNALLDPALRDAATIGQRTRGGLSNQSNLISRFQERILPQIRIDSTKDKYDLFDRDQDRFREQTAGAGGQLINAGAGGFQPNIPGVQSFGGAALNKIGAPPQTSPSGMGAAFGAGVQNLGGAFEKYAANQTSKDNFQKLLGKLGNQGDDRWYSGEV
jgi:hypothetical protein